CGRYRVPAEDESRREPPGDADVLERSGNPIYKLALTYPVAPPIIGRLVPVINFGANPVAFSLRQPLSEGPLLVAARRLNAPAHVLRVPERRQPRVRRLMHDGGRDIGGGHILAQNVSQIQLASLVVLIVRAQVTRDLQSHPDPPQQSADTPVSPRIVSTNHGQCALNAGKKLIVWLLTDVGHADPEAVHHTSLGTPQLEAFAEIRSSHPASRVGSG